MRLKDLQQVTSIDQEITSLQQRLTDLYEARAALLQPSGQPETDTFTLYKKLSDDWGRLGIQIPEFKKLEALLEKSLHIKNDWEKLQPVLQGSLQVLLVPPASIVGLPAYDELRKKQRLLQGSDIVSSDVRLPKGSAKWRVFVVYGKGQGIAMDDGSIAYNSKPTTALGIHEYIALTMQLSQPIDTTTWTSFINGKKDAPVVYAGCRHGRYRFGINDIPGVLDDDRFRPAVEVKIR